MTVAEESSPYALLYQNKTKYSSQKTNTSLAWHDDNNEKDNANKTHQFPHP